MNRIMSFLAGVFCGAVVGSVTALLMAPSSGQELQTNARDRFDHLVDDARKAAAAKRSELETQLNALKVQRPSDTPEMPAAEATA